MVDEDKDDEMGEETKGKSSKEAGRESGHMDNSRVSAACHCCFFVCLIGGCAGCGRMDD